MNKKTVFLFVIFFIFTFYLRFLPEKTNKFYFCADSTFYLRALNQFKKHKTLSIKDNLFVKKEKRTFAKIAPPLLIYSAYIFEKIPYINRLKEKRAISTFNALWGTLVSFLFLLLLFYITENLYLSLLLSTFFTFFTPFYLKSDYILFRGEAPSIFFFIATVFILYKALEKDKITTKFKISYLILFLLGMGFWRLFPLLLFPVLFGIIVEKQISKNISINTLHTIFFITLLGTNFSLFYEFYRLNLPLIFLYNIIIFAFIIYQLISDKIKNKGLLNFYLYFPILLLISMVILRFYRFYHIKGISTSLELYEKGVSELLPADFLYIIFYLIIFTLILIFSYSKNIKCEIKKKHMHLFLVPYSIFLLAGISFKRVEPYPIMFLVIIVSIFIIKIKNLTLKRAIIAFVILITIFFTYQSFKIASLYPDQNQLIAYNYIKENIDKKMPIIALWGNGYEIEYYTKHPAIMDGYLEDKITRERILKFFEVLNSKNELELVAFLKRFNSKYIFLNKYYIKHILSTKGSWKDYIKANSKNKKLIIVVKKKGNNINIIKLLFLHNRLKFFKPLFFKGNYGILMLKKFK